MSDPVRRRFYNIEDAGATLRVEVAWLKKWLKKNPFSRDGKPHYFKIGHHKNFDRHQLTLIYYQLRDTGIIKEQIDIWNGEHFDVDRERPGETLGIVYFVDGGDCVKIGYSRSPKDRFKKMLTDASSVLKLLHVERGTMNQEKVFHRHFAAIRDHGEWFRKTPELLEFIEQRKQIKGMA